MRCQCCNREIEDGSIFCSECGAKQEEQKIINENICPACGIVLTDEDIFCPECGHKLVQISGATDCQKQLEQSSGLMKIAETQKEKTTGKKVIALLIGVLIVGCIGVFAYKHFHSKEKIPIVILEEKEQNKLETENVDDSSEEIETDSNSSIEDSSVKTNTDDTIEEKTLEQVSMEKIISVTATSSLSEYNMTHSPERVIDGNLANAWVEGGSGQGIGETITIRFDKNYQMKGFIIYAGYQKNENVYWKNSRPAQIKITFSDGTSKVFSLEDVLRAQEFAFEKPVETDSISFTIEAVYPGTQYEDCVISEIYIW